MNTIDWIERTKRRHRQCLEWRSNGAAALAVSVPTGVPRNWSRWFQDPDVMLEGELAKLENCLAVRSDVVPVVYQPLAKMRAEEPGPAGYQDAFDARHGGVLLKYLLPEWSYRPYTPQMPAWQMTKLE